MLVPYQPNFYIQYVPGVYGHLASGHPVFGLDNVHHYYHFNMQWPGLIDPYVQFAPNETLAQVADAAVTGILTLRNKLLENFPNKTFRYGFGPAGFDLKFPHNTGIDNSLFDNDNDRITVTGIGGTPILTTSLYHVSGIIAVSGRMAQFFSLFKTKLDLHSLPYPDFIDPDFEGDAMNWDNASGTQSTDWVRNKMAILNQARAGTELIDGYHTWQYYANNAFDLSYNPIPTGQLWPFIYTLDNENIYHSLASIGGKVASHCLKNALFDIAKVYFPDTKTFNYNYFASSREYPTWSYRPKEFGPDATGYFNFDSSVPSLYGPPLTDTLDKNGVTGYASYTNCLAIWNVSSGATHETTLQNMYLGFAEYMIRNSRLSDPSRTVAPWLMDNIVIPSGKMDAFPHTFLLTHDLLKDTMRICAEYDVDTIGIFNIAPNDYQDRAELLYNLITDMGDIYIDDGNPSNPAIAYRASTVARFGGGFFKY